MPVFPIRGVGEIGVITDQSPQDLPIHAWTDARNIRFSNKTVSRYSVFKKVSSANTYAKTPVGVLKGGANHEGYLVTVFTDGTISQITNGASMDVTPVGASGVTDVQMTTTTLGGLTYINRVADVPYYRKDPGEGAFKKLTGWDPSDRCQALRSYKDFLVALNVSKGGIDYHGMIKWSDAAQYGLPPDDWDVLDPSSLAGETVLNDLRGHLVDGLALGDTFILYGNNQTFRMDFIGAPFVFQVQKLFEDQGAIAQNCAVYVDNVHYVFGRTDIYMHDGVSKQSIVTKKVAKRIFSDIDQELAYKCFVYHDRVNNEIAFCYPSKGDDNKWSAVDCQSCNKAAVYNYKDLTWTFVDLPGLVGWTEVSLSEILDWEAIEGSWGSTVSAWSSVSGVAPEGLVLCSRGRSGDAPVSPQPYFLDSGSGGLHSTEVVPEVLWDAYCERIFCDLDEIAPDLLGRKLLRRLVIQYSLGDEEYSLRVSVGKTNVPAGITDWGRMKTITGYVDSKYDSRINDRYFSVRFEFPAGSFGEINGFDADIQKIAGR
ncbi:hypothetical protein Q9295_10200 [Xinfangfangia sp. CPCC 101601]|uniref:Uncharacterized protein n=1 Tax=Pseudogemmobacter lacusdianii TaxID=3069608 RepID=A0ABU0VYF9_9RHOB|nr:hypothetical protein [Xinfangfangia sp. CPCC 101601]MDQ2066749.1 hypothetical protein [Xinfangfangia sp. CPCC 101601]